MPAVTAARYVTLRFRVTPRYWKRPGFATAPTAMDVVRSKSVAVAPPWSVPRPLRSELLGVKRKSVVLRMPYGEVLGEGALLVARCWRLAWKGVS